MEDPTIKQIYFTEVDKIPIKEIDIDFYKKLSYYDNTKEAESETFTNSMIMKSAESNFASIQSNKQIYSDCFHYWLNKEKGIRDFIYITEYKTGNLTYCEQLSALVQVIYYYYVGLYEHNHQDDENVLYLLVICDDRIIIYDAKSVNKEIFNLITQLKKAGYKITGSNLYRKNIVLDNMVEQTIPVRTFENTGKGIAQAILYMRNNYELNRN